MKKLKKRLLQGAFAAEMIVFVGIYIGGAHGMQTLFALQREVALVEHDVIGLRKQVKALEGELHAWNTCSFLKEKVAREQLQMAREDDVVFYIS